MIVVFGRRGLGGVFAVLVVGGGSGGVKGGDLEGGDGEEVIVLCISDDVTKGMTCAESINPVRVCSILGGGEKFRSGADDGRAGVGGGGGGVGDGNLNIRLRVTISLATSSSFTYRS
jgi:hypothetical protein